MTTSELGDLLAPAPRPVGPASDGLVADAGLLFHVDGATEGTTQWKAETFQLVNWGGFEGRVRFDFHPGATLISGASGTGKSTLLDAYIALMMPSDTSFNGASNDAVGGRARSADQRNLLSYLRGQTDTTADADGRETAKVLRGERTATWGAIGMTFIDDHGRRFTAFRVYYVPARARQVSGQVTMRMATYDGVLDFADLAEHIGAGDQHFVPKALKAAFPGLKTHDSYAAFATTLHTKLGIGANGDGEKALRLLVRIQSGQQIKTVDELYKEMVLERPATYAAADRAIEHFDDLEAAYLAMQTEQDKATLLTPITDLHQRLLTARAEVETIDTFGLTHPGDTPVKLWSLRTEATLLTDAVDANGTARQLNTDRLRGAREAEQGLTGELEVAQEEHRRNGGDDLARLAREIEDKQRLREDRLARRATLAERTTALAAPLATREDFDRLRADADAFLGTFTGRQAREQKQRDDLMREQFPLSERKAQLTADRDSFAGRAGRVPRALDEMRRQVAAAAGMDPSELPFLAELIDVAAEDDRWRTAIETVLGASARLLLVPRERLGHFSAAIDPLHLRGRLQFEGVPSHLPHTPSSDRARVAGKLLYADHPFSGWVTRHVSEPARNALCVETAADLAGDGYRVTRAGQTRSGSRGSHGRNDTANVIGFSNADAIEDIDAQLRKLTTQLHELDQRRAEVDQKLAGLGRRQLAYEAVQAARWEDIDVAGVEARIAELESNRRTILESDDRLRAIEAHIKALKARLETAQQQRFALQASKKDLDARHGELAERQDEVTVELIRIDDEHRVVLGDEQTTRLDKEFAAAAAPGDPANLTDFTKNMARLYRRLNDAVDGARQDAERTAAELGRIFISYQHSWPDPNFGITAESYPDYARVLDNIITTGLHARREEWRRRLTLWSGQDLVPLNGAMRAAVEEIEDRLAPINDILATLPFGAGQDRLRIKLRRLTPEHVTQFRRDLAQLSSVATAGLDDAQMERRFAELQQFMAQIRRREDPRATAELSDRDRLLDVRRHVDITAERYNDAGQVQSVHSALGGKSGGESQELVAFIVGAALRFRLGDELRARPRFAPVFLDEGFVKADAEFAGRAVQAWKGLGFQLIVGAPLDKVTALEPHMDDFLAITKNTATGYAFVDRVEDAPGDQS
ncbi:ATP-binding protein [Modestobacter sp. VKM Ac-2984]|uniref:ATP-binding protein n=1 Tax=Modestobacter sp. VKM Ac-2984 TaxID=3004138 RepID=UPI0022AA8A6B|nr:SbcC/MukB-like Walker B domain-containing protein [Modestobacter sp. VKM Ac-2984]MCZ2818031.1 SbcC/MukB-like Walker B domain-containing protein [Modestobacter sp. VKM Ac-2984]